MKTISNPSTKKDKLFSKAQEACRKDVERTFGRLLSKWHILGVASNTWFLKNLCSIWKACFILHNMTLRDNQNTGYDSKGAAVIARELRRDHAIVRRMRQSSNVAHGEDGGGVDGGEDFVPRAGGGEGADSTAPASTRATQPIRQRRAKGGRSGGARGRRRGRGRRGGEAAAPLGEEGMEVDSTAPTSTQATQPIRQRRARGGKSGRARGRGRGRGRRGGEAAVPLGEEGVEVDSTTPTSTQATQRRRLRRARGGGSGGARGRRRGGVVAD